MLVRRDAVRVVATTTLAAVIWGSLAVAPVPFASSTTVAVAAPAAPAPSGPSSRYVAVGPVRLADTRREECGCTRLDGSTLRVVVAGRDGVPEPIVAAAVTVTAVSPAAAGYATAYPAGGARPGTSTVNVVAGKDTANSAIIPVGADGAIDVFTLVPMDVVVDVTGVFVEATTATAGRFVAVAPKRLVDTRTTHPLGLPVGGGVDVALPAGVSPDATALVVNVTSVDAFAPGFVTARPAGDEPSSTSFVNPDGSGSATAATVILPVSPAGLTVDTYAGGQLLVDLVGWFTGDGAPASPDGLFVPTTPTRLLDTRGERPRLWPSGARELPSPVPGVVALVTNVTMDLADGPGYVTAFPAGTALPDTSSLNAPRRDAAVANLAVTTVSERGITYFASRGTDLVVDLTGWFTGTAVAAPLPPLPNVAPNPRVLLVGDSTLAALNVSKQSQRALLGFQPVLDAEPCRRLVRPSCKSDFTLRVPNTAVQAIAGTPGVLDGVVIKTGYNDGSAGFEEAVAQVMAVSRAKGARFVIWLTYSEGHTANHAVTYPRNNATLHRLAGSAAYPDLFVADWRTYAAPSSGWYASDRTHLNGAGAWATSDYISRWVAAVTRLPCPQPWTPGGPVFDPCPTPDAVAALTATLPNLRALYGF